MLRRPPGLWIITCIICVFSSERKQSSRNFGESEYLMKLYIYYIGTWSSFINFSPVEGERKIIKE